MRDIINKLGKDTSSINPLVPVDLVIDHSVQVDHFKEINSLALNTKLEFERNEERYSFLSGPKQHLRILELFLQVMG